MKPRLTARHALASLALSVTSLVALSSPAAAAVPGDVLDLTNWKLTIPFDGSDSNTYADEIKQPQLRTYQSQDYFKAVDGPGVRFTTLTNGATTSGSHFPRTELREMKRDGTVEAKWSNSNGRKHVMTYELAIFHLPDVKPHLVVGQIHDSERDIIVLRAERKSDGKYRIFAKANDVTLSPDLDSDYQLGTRFKAKLLADGQGGVVAKYWESPTDPTPAQVSARDNNTPEGGGWYFKAGCYPQATSRDPDPRYYGTGYGKVIIYTLTVNHG